jgi:nitrogen fixation protein NifU and related proteins
VYSDILLEHFQAPRNNGTIPDADAGATAENPVCGDRLQVWLKIHGDRVDDLRWQAEGCAPAIAAASAMSEMVRGLTLAEARGVDREAVTAALGGLPPGKAHAAQLAASALRQALDDFAGTADSH